MGPVTGWTDEDERLAVELKAAQTALHAGNRTMLELVARAQRCGLGVKGGYRSEADFLHLTQNITKAQANARIAAAEAVMARTSLLGETLPAELPATAAAVSDDAIGLEHVTAIRGVLGRLPAHLESSREWLEGRLAEWSRTFDPYGVRLLGSRVLDALDPDGPEPRDADPARSRLAIAAARGGFALSGWLAPEEHAILMTALSPLARPVPSADGVRDGRTVAERHGAALVEVARRLLAAGDLPADNTGNRPHLVVTVPLDALESGRGSGLLDFADGTLTGAIAAEDARRIACDAYRSYLRLDENDLPLSVGRRTRVVPRRIRRALHQRDRGCAFPGCVVPAQWTDAHHIVHWVEGGPTELANLVLLCPSHHTMLHQSEWSVSMVDGIPLFHPPPWQRAGPLRNLFHRPDLVVADRSRRL